MSKSPLDFSKLAKNKTIIIVLAVVLLLLLIICLALWIPYISGMLSGDNNGTNNETSGGWEPSTCEELLGRAMDASYRGCQSIDSNQVCYGNFNVSAQLAEDSSSEFATLGDTIAVNQLITLNTSPMDLVQDIWGIAVFKLQANLPGTIPGQNVTFLVFGDTGLYNYSGDMYSIYFSTGIGSVTCSQVPDGLKVDVPEGSGVIFTANGAEIALEGDSVLMANPGGDMSIAMLNGSGTVTADGQSQSLEAGEYVTVPLGDDLESNGPPSIPLPIPGDDALELCLLTEENCDPEDPLSWLKTPTPDSDVVLEIATYTPIPVDPGQPTNTSVPLGPTATSGSGPTNTSPPPPTNTPSPTDTVAAATCSNVSLGGYIQSGNTISLMITNNNAGPVVIDRIQLTWDEGISGLLNYVILDDNTLWGQGKTTSPSPADITLGTTNVPHRTLASGTSLELFFEFENNPAALINSLKIYFDIGCSKSK